MPYNKLLIKLINESGLQIKEIAEKCKVYGEEITPSYISLLKNNPSRIPSDKISRAIAKACGAKYENALVIEGYIDNAPDEFKEFFVQIKKMIVASTLMVFDKSIPANALPEIEKELKEMPIAYLICSVIENPEIIQIDKNFESNNSSVTVCDDNANISLTMKEPEGFIMEDESMYPVIPQNSKVTLDVGEKITSGDIVCYKPITENKLKIRRYMPIDGKNIAFIPINNGFEAEILNEDNFILLGKVGRVIIKL